MVEFMNIEKVILDWNEYIDAARAVVAEGCVLLENNGVLPLDPKKKIVYIGEYAEKPSSFPFLFSGLIAGYRHGCVPSCTSAQSLACASSSTCPLSPLSLLSLISLFPR